MNIEDTHTFEPDDLKEAVACLKKGGIILYPTDTVWGIGCDATNAEAVARIFALKRRAESKSMIVLMANEAQLERYVDTPEDVVFELLETADKPLTLILDGAVGLAPNLIAGDGSIGLRIPKNKFVQSIIRGLRTPLVSTSANVSGAPAAASFSEISPEIIEGVDYICLHRRQDNTRHKPSAIIKISKGGVFKILRQ